MYSIYDQKSRYISNISLTCVDDVEKIILDSIDKSEKINIIYNEISGGQTERVIHPLHLFKYNDEYYVTAFCELRNDIRHFELKRISSIK